MGMSPGNGHPYSWAAICNGYDKKAMADCPFPVIPKYLAKQKFPAARLPGAVVTHIWTQDKKISRHIAAAALIKNIVDDPEQMIGRVDAVVLARDDGENHLKMAKPFIEASVPILIDKPLTDRDDDLRQFIKYYKQGKTIMSCSSMRYSPSILNLKKRKDLGKILTANCICSKYWRTYGIHLIEAVYTVMGGGIASVQNVGKKNEDIVHMLYRDGRHALLQTFAHVAAFNLSFYGKKGCASPGDADSFLQFKEMLAHFIEYLRTGKPPFDWRETVETAKVVIAGEKSLKEGGRIVRLEEI
jgi:predicted dehydrogenase